MITAYELKIEWGCLSDRVFVAETFLILENFYSLIQNSTQCLVTINFTLIYLLFSGYRICGAEFIKAMRLKKIGKK